MERRSELRHKTSQVVKIIVPGEQGFAAPALIEDVSMHGMGMLLHRPIPAGASIKIALGDALLLGSVCHCSSTYDGFRVGIRLDQAVTRAGGSMNLDRTLFEILRNFLVEA